MFEVSEHSYLSGGVSWQPNAGTYYIHRVDGVRYEVKARRL